MDKMGNVAMGARGALACLLALSLVTSCVPRAALAQAPAKTTDAADPDTTAGSEDVDEGDSANEAASVHQDDAEDATAYAGKPDAHASIADDVEHPDDRYDAEDTSPPSNPGEHDTSDTTVPTLIEATGISDATAESADQLGVASPDDSNASKLVTSSSVIPGGSSLKLWTHAARVGDTGPYEGGRVGASPATGNDVGDGDGMQYQSFRLTVNNTDGVDGGISYSAYIQNMEWVANYSAWVAAGSPRPRPAWSSDGEWAGGKGYSLALENFKIQLYGTLAKCYDIHYLGTYSRGREPNTGYYTPWHAGETYSASNGSMLINGGASTGTGDACAFKVMKVWLTLKSYTHKVAVRYQNADGTYGNWQEVRSGSYAYSKQVPGWSRQGDGVYQGASMGAYTAGYKDTTMRLDINRQSRTTTFDANGGEGGGSVTKLAGATYGTDLPKATRDGYAFVGWYTQRVGGSRLDGTTTVSNGTYYARWMDAPQIKVVAPVALHYVAHRDGSVSGPSDGVVAIANDGAIDARVCEIRVEGVGGFDVVTGAPGDNEVSLSVTPGEGTADILGDYVGGSAPGVASDWVIAAGERLYLNNLVGRIGTADLSADTAVGIIHWTFGATDGSA